MRILIAEDCADARATLAALLAASGHEVFAAADGDEAMAMAVRHVPHAAFFDLAMPRRDGYEVAERIHRLLPDTILVAVTGRAPQEHLRERDAIFDRYLVKPVEIEQLLGALDAARQ